MSIAAIFSSETSITTYKTTRRHNPEDHNQHFIRSENLKSHTYSEMNGSKDSPNFVCS
jgi:hypothetical protein